MRAPCSVKTRGMYFLCSPRPFFKVAICDLKASFSSLVRTNAKSSGKRSMFLFTCSLSRLTDTLYRAARSESRMTLRPRTMKIVCSTRQGGRGFASLDDTGLVENSKTSKCPVEAADCLMELTGPARPSVARGRQGGRRVPRVREPSHEVFQRNCGALAGPVRRGSLPTKFSSETVAIRACGSLAMHLVRMWHTRALENFAGPSRSVHPLALGVEGG